MLFYSLLICVLIFIVHLICLKDTAFSLMVILTDASILCKYVWSILPFVRAGRPIVCVACMDIVSQNVRQTELRRIRLNMFNLLSSSLLFIQRKIAW